MTYEADGKRLPEHLRRIASRDYVGVNEGFWIAMDAADRLEKMEHAFRLIGTKCSNFTGVLTCVDDEGRAPDAKYGAELWCNECIAREALKWLPGVVRIGLPRPPRNPIEQEINPSNGDEQP